MSLDKSVIMLLYYLKKYSLSTYEHSIKVAFFASKFGRYLNLSEKELIKLKTACLLHDIGKLKIPLEILHKPGKLTHEEYEKIKNHSKYGYDLLVKVGFKDKEVLKMILEHHERLDGNGYPLHINNENIDLLTRILTICDCYDAMKSKRDYKEEKDIGYIKNEFIENAGTQFDKEYTYMLLNYIDIINRKKVVR